MGWCFIPEFPEATKLHLRHIGVEYYCISPYSTRKSCGQSGFLARLQGPQQFSNGHVDTGSFLDCHR